MPQWRSNAERERAFKEWAAERLHSQDRDFYVVSYQNGKNGKPPWNGNDKHPFAVINEMNPNADFKWHSWLAGGPGNDGIPHWKLVHAALNREYGVVLALLRGDGAFRSTYWTKPQYTFEGNPNGPYNTPKQAQRARDALGLDRAKHPVTKTQVLNEDMFDQDEMPGEEWSPPEYGLLNRDGLWMDNEADVVGLHRRAVIALGQPEQPEYLVRRQTRRL